jgi:hypothetical protein
MTIRVSLSAALLIIATASTASAGTPATITASTFGCPSTGVTLEHNTVWKKKGYDAAFALAKPNGCLPYTVGEQVTVIYGSDEAKCAIRQFEMGPCLWVPASLLKAN